MGPDSELKLKLTTKHTAGVDFIGSRFVISTAKRRDGSFFRLFTDIRCLLAHVLKLKANNLGDI